MAHEMYSRIPVGTMYNCIGINIGDEISYLNINFIDGNGKFGAVIIYDDGYDKFSKTEIVEESDESIVSFKFSIEDVQYHLNIIKDKNNYTSTLRY